MYPARFVPVRKSAIKQTVVLDQVKVKKEAKAKRNHVAAMKY